MTHKQDDILDDKPLVLVVEDDDDIRLFIALRLGTDFQVMEAVNGQDGLEKARLLMPDLVVTDLMMPVLDGISLCRELKTGLETSHIPVLMLTSKTSVESQIEGLETGADDYVTKPFHMTLLKARIHNLLESRRMLHDRFNRDFMLSGQELSVDILNQDFLRGALAVLEEQCSDPEFSADRFAGQMKMSLSTLHRKLKSLTGETPSRMIWNVRLKKAAELLKMSDLSVTEIAFNVGYSDSNHFGRQFKQCYGETPSLYRKNADAST